MADVLNPDICVIGAGSGGYDVAAAAAALGVPVVLVEPGPIDASLLGCGLPLGALVAAARRARAVREADAFGVIAKEAEVDFQRVHEHVQSVIAAVTPNVTKERLIGLGVRVIEAAACFKDQTTVVAGPATEITARRFVIATGSSPALPPIPGLATTPHLTADTIFDLRACPRHLIVIGAGSTGLALGQAFRRLGAMVTVLDASEVLSREDPECTRIVLDQFVEEGIAVRGGVAIARVEAAPSQVRVVLGGDGAETVEGSHLLVACGRRANLGGLGLDAAGIRHEPHGIVVDAALRTANKRVYAIGSVTGAPAAPHAAAYHAGLVIRNALFRSRGRVDNDTVPRLTLTDPELAHVGLTEAQARLRGHAIRVLRWPYRENDRAQAERAVRGHAKVLTGRTGRILGATIVGAGAGELIVPWSLAVGQGLRIQACAGMLVPYPTLAEVGKRAASTYLTAGLTSSWVRRIMGLLRRLG
ncbi:MAG: hypothetical protein QOI12_1405 [Alphaproteobacteria bacterium]|jgi:pyruvate/2-oxoglutarate dehydrogenase complex dihydrolipoamide dehydrogenase (E3) component|nr:hypothetical protein [Alphaproteobacteria bacterium]